MNPLIANPTFNAILQYVYAIGIIAGVLAPLFKSLPTAYAFLQRLTGLGGDLGKTFGARRVPSDAGPVPVKASTPGPTIVSALMTVCISMLAGILFAIVALSSSVSCSAAQTKSVLVNALSVEQIACILANESPSSEPPAVAAVCSIPPELVKEVEGLILAARRARSLKDGGK